MWFKWNMNTAAMQMNESGHPDCTITRRQPQGVRVNAIEGDHTTVLELCHGKLPIQFPRAPNRRGVKSSGRMKYFYVYDDAAIRFEEIKSVQPIERALSGRMYGA